MEATKNRDITEREYNLSSTIVKGYNISTAYRKASILDGGRYYETIVWEYSNMERGKMLEQEMAGFVEEDAIKYHIDRVLHYMTRNDISGRT